MHVCVCVCVCVCGVCVWCVCVCVCVCVCTPDRELCPETYTVISRVHTNKPMCRLLGKLHNMLHHYFLLFWIVKHLESRMYVIDV